MPRAIVVDKTMHIVHPEKDKETFCTESFTEDNVVESFGGAYYIDYVLSTLRSKADDELEEECQSCIQNSDKYGMEDIKDS